MNIATKYFSLFHESQRAMAASTQSMEYCEAIIKQANLSTILDAGSGFSSAFFHSRYQNVVTVDDEASWAKKTTDFIAAHLNKEIQIKPITAIKNQTFDFIFYDYGNIETRIYHFKRVLEMCRKCLYVDDMHISYYRDYVQTKSRSHFCEILPVTIDEFGRYGALIVK